MDREKWWENSEKGGVQKRALSYQIVSPLPPPPPSSHFLKVISIKRVLFVKIYLSISRNKAGHRHVFHLLQTVKLNNNLQVYVRLRVILFSRFDSWCGKVLILNVKCKMCFFCLFIVTLLNIVQKEIVIISSKLHFLSLTFPLDIDEFLNFIIQKYEICFLTQ